MRESRFVPYPSRLGVHGVLEEVSMHSYSTSRVFGIAVTAAAAICLVGPAIAHAQNAQPSAGGSATFTKDVAPIFQRACQN